MRSLSGSEYCSTEHKKADIEKFRQLAIQRLRPTAKFRQTDPQQPVEKESVKAEPVSSPRPAEA